MADSGRFKLWLAMAIVGLLLLALIVAGVFVFEEMQGPSESVVGPAPGGEAGVSYSNIEADRHGAVAVARVIPGGQVWAGTSGRGVGVYDPASQSWRWFTTAEGLGENFVTAITADQQGRIWAGHLSRGVSIYNGRAWKDYGPARGPLSARIFAITVCPIDGDVWIAGDCGLSRYSPKTDRWSYFTRATSGLPSDQASAIAFDLEGNIYLGLQCEGVAIASRVNGYADWHTIPGAVSMPLSDLGDGLPSNIVSDLVVGSDGTVYAATPHGLGIGKNRGQSWTFVRGKNWKENIAGLEVTSTPAGSGDGAFLAQDRCTALAVDDAGRLFVGHWHGGVDVLDCAKLPAAGALLETIPLNAVAQSLSASDSAGVVLVGSPNMVRVSLALPEGATSTQPSVKVAAQNASAELPSQAAPPSGVEIDAMIVQAKSLPKATDADDPVEYIGEDWATRGDWMGRFGRNFTALFGMAGQLHVYGDTTDFQVTRATGSHLVDGAGPGGYFFYGGKVTRDTSVLYDPQLHTRYNGEWNDGSFQETRYPEMWEGPDLGVGLTVPPGNHRVTLYFLNVERARKKPEPFRDYEVEVKRTDSGDFNDAEATPTLARTEVVDFGEGVYKEFLLRGAGQYWFKVDRNGSSCTKASAIFVDDVSSSDASDGDIAWPREFGHDAVAASPHNTSPAVLKARDLWIAANNIYSRKGGGVAQKPLRMFAYRAALAGGADDDLLSNWQRRLGIWTENDRKRFDGLIAQPTTSPAR